MRRKGLTQAAACSAAEQKRYRSRQEKWASFGVIQESGGSLYGREEERSKE